MDSRYPYAPPCICKYIYISFPLSGGLYSKHKEKLICLLVLEATERNAEDLPRESNIIPMKHLRDQNLTYIGHLLQAWNLAMRLFLLSLTALVHGVFPSIWVRSVSEKVREMDADLS